MLFLRSLVFNIAFYIALIALMLFGLPALLWGRHGVFFMARLWARCSFWLMRVVCNMRVEFRGTLHIPKGAVIIAPKHQSLLDVFVMLEFFPDFSYVLKRELTWLPLFGWYLAVAEQIAIDRSRGRDALPQLIAKTKDLFAEGRQLFIFPEGTRRPAGAPPAYKSGVARLYAESNVPCLPVAINAGLFWARRNFLRYPGTVVVQFLPPIAPGLGRERFYALLQLELETATDALIAEACAKGAKIPA